VNETAASTAKLAKCILLHAYSRKTVSSQLCENQGVEPNLNLNRKLE